LFFNRVPRDVVGGVGEVGLGFEAQAGRFFRLDVRKRAGDGGVTGWLFFVRFWEFGRWRV